MNSWIQLDGNKESETSLVTSTSIEDTQFHFFSDGELSLTWRFHLFGVVFYGLHTSRGLRLKCETADALLGA